MDTKARHDWEEFIAILMTLMFVASVFYGCGIEEGKRQGTYVRTEQLNI